MKANRIIREIIENGLSNSEMQMYVHNEAVGLHCYFGQDYTITGKVLEDGSELVAIWSDDCGEPRIKGIADVVLVRTEKDKIYLYEIE
jgi:hypothetical protein